MDAAWEYTHPVLQRVPLGGHIIKHCISKGDDDLPKEVIASKHVTVPHRDPQCATLQLTHGCAELQNKRLQVRKTVSRKLVKFYVLYGKKESLYHYPYFCNLSGNFKWVIEIRLKYHTKTMHLIPPLTPLVNHCPYMF